MRMRRPSFRQSSIRARDIAGVLALSVTLASCFGGPSGAAAGGGSRSDTAPASAAGGVYKVGSPYEVAGVWYYPAEDPDYDQTGVASWYGSEFGGRPTANGERFDPRGLTAAHTTLPMPSRVQVTNLENGRNIVVRVNDRGPFKRGRIIDLSEAAADRLGFREAGVARVRVRYLGPAALHGEPEERVPAIATPEDASRVASAAPLPEVEGGRLPDAPPTYRAPATVNPPVSTRYAGAARDPGDLWVQLGAFLERANAERLLRRLPSGDPARIARADVDGRTFYRVRVGPFETIDAADRALDDVLRAGHNTAAIVVD